MQCFQNAADEIIILQQGKIERKNLNLQRPGLASRFDKNWTVKARQADKECSLFSDFLDFKDFKFRHC